MNAGVFLKIKAVISLGFGIAFVFASSLLMPLYGITLDRAGTLVAQWTGAIFIGVGLICWFASKAAGSELLKGVLLSLFIADSIGFVVTLMGQLAGVTNALGWSTVAIWLLLALGLGYFRFVSKA
jgi:hypothetical protein